MSLSPLIPKSQDLSVFLSVNYDPGSRLAIAFGVKALWIEPEESRVKDESRGYHSWKPGIFIIDKRDRDVERIELAKFIDYIFFHT